MIFNRKRQNCLYIVLIFLISLLLICSNMSVAFSAVRVQDIRTIPSQVRSGKLNKYSIEDPHWDVKLCNTCHNGTPSKANKKLLIRDVNKLCDSCHNFIPDNLINHPVNIKVGNKMLAKMPNAYKKTLSSSLVKKGTVSCLTCHDVIMQCTPRKFIYKGRNPEFFRSGPFRTRTDICYKCHQGSSYKRFNPHKQISASGKIKKNTCYVCHQNVDNLNTIKSAKQLKFNVGKDYTQMCIGCHIWKPHPGGELSFGKKVPNHLVIPSAAVKKQMKRTLAKNKEYFPLEPETGKVHCATCHNVHQKNVIKNRVKNKGADSKNRLRRKKSCILCHIF